ncbi:O-antigen ligase family protein [Sporosarcina sp. FSL K6-2383]|uniref:O-antigen ligase family protein n=1 Tax=Sporosarcina sp. FSL K6-2383 TaxID=2921556 RepID=UPI00315AD2DB
MTSFYQANTKILKDEEEDRLSRIKVDRWIFTLLLLAVGLVPLIVGGHARTVISPQITNVALLSSGVKGDIFTNYKASVLIVIAIIAISLLFSKVFFMSGEIRKTKLNIFVGIFAIAITISTILSPSISIALWGQYNRSDGAISYLCYLALFFVAMNIDYPKKALHYVMYSFYPFVIINFILITMNFYGHDAMIYPIVQKMMTLFLPEGASLGDGAIFLGTLNQWNFMSGMFAVMMVMYLAWAIVDKNTIRSFVNVGVSVMTLAVMLMSISTSGFLTVLAITPLLVWLAIKSTDRKKAVIALCAFVVVSLPVFHVLAEKNPRVWNESIGFIFKKNPYVKEQPVATVPINFGLTVENNRVYAAENSFELPVLPGRGTAAGSGRAYIWSKTIDLTMDRPIFGFGLDTIMYHFPHYNIDARAGMRSEHTIVDKPHNMYVGIFYGTGIIGFIGFAGLAIIMALGGLKAVVTRRSIVPTVFAVGWLAYLIQALFNDTLPGTAAPMWAIAGMMMAFILRNKEVEEIIDGRND